MVEITEIDRDEALRYLCCHDENNIGETAGKYLDCLLYTSDAADD